MTTMPKSPPPPATEIPDEEDALRGLVDEMEGHPPGYEFLHPIGLGRSWGREDRRTCEVCRSWFIPDIQGRTTCPICLSEVPTIGLPGYPGVTLRVLPVSGMILLEVGHPPQTVVSYYYDRGLHLRVVGVGPCRDLDLPAEVPPGPPVVVHRLTFRPITRLYLAPA